MSECLDCPNITYGDAERCWKCAKIWRAEALCITCGESLADRKATRYCSKRCCDIARGQVRAEPLPERTCALDGCGKTFRPRRDMEQCCCESHGKKHWLALNPDKHRLARAGYDPDKRRACYDKRRAIKKGATTGDPVVFTAIAERDGWRCHICRRKVPKARAWPHPLSSSLDHLVPLASGGSHDPVNVRLAHLSCNLRKNARAANDQLLLFG